MFETTLHGDLPLLVRRVGPSDKDLLLAGFDDLSDRSRFFRFLRAMTSLSALDLERFTRASDDERCAFGAMDVGHALPKPVAIARYERIDVQPSAAEMAVTVIDAYQGKGVGSLLIGAIAVCALRAGIERFFAFVHPLNVGMIGLLRSLGAQADAVTDEERKFVLPLFHDPDLYPDTRSGQVLRMTYRLMAADTRQ